MNEMISAFANGAKEAVDSMVETENVDMLFVMYEGAVKCLKRLYVKKKLEILETAHSVE